MFFASSEPALEEPASSLIRANDGASVTSRHSVEDFLCRFIIYIASARQLHGFQKDSIGTVIVVRSLDAAGKLSVSISNLSRWLELDGHLVASFAISYITTTWIAGDTGPYRKCRAVGAGIYDQDAGCRSRRTWRLAAA